MIKITRIAAPVQLTSELVVSLTAEYASTGGSVWNIDFIKDALLIMSNNKCCYCECKIDEESKYLEVEHFKPKSHFSNLVVDWNNLLPSCKHCNGHKKDINTDIEPIINPTIDDPKLYLQLKAYRLYPRDRNTLGKNTIDFLDLNDRDRLVKKRFEIGDKMGTVLCQLDDDVNELSDFLLAGVKKTRQKNRILSTLKNLLIEAQPSSEYSATAASVIINDMYYNSIKSNLQSLGMWSIELQDLENVASNYSLQ